MKESILDLVNLVNFFILFWRMNPIIYSFIFIWLWGFVWNVYCYNKNLLESVFWFIPLKNLSHSKQGEEDK